MITASLIVIFGMLGAYAGLCAVAAGVGLLRLLPRSTYTRHSLQLFTLRWQVTHLLLLAALIGIWYFYANDLTQRSLHRIAPIALLTLGLLVFQSALQTIAVVKKLPTGFRLLNISYVLISFMSILSLAATAIVGLIGANFWHAKIGWALMVLAGIAATALAFSYVYYAVGRTPHDRLHQVSRWLTVAAGGIGVLVFVELGRQHNHRLSVSVPIALLGATVVLQIIGWFTARERYMWWYGVFCVVVIPIAIALANRPYLLYPTVNVQAASTPAVGTVIILIGTALLVISGILRVLWPLTQTVSKR